MYLNLYPIQSNLIQANCSFIGTYNMAETNNFNNIIGYFGPDSMSWRLYREPVVLLGGFRALLLQIAHPAVGDGVKRFSNFEQDALGRGYRTFRAMATIYFGTQEQADATSERLKRIHSGISGSNYRATDHDLQCWVWATLVHTTLVIYAPLRERLRLPDDWDRQFYAESQRMATILGIEEAVIPVDLGAFQAYFEQMLSADGVLGEEEVSATLAQSIVYHRWVPQPMGRLLAIGWLPDFLCKRLQLKVNTGDRQRFERLVRRLARLMLWLPVGIRTSPAWYQASHRIARAKGQKSTIGGYFFTWLGLRMAVPLGIPMG
jgi:uncharacterized protein (DUF2236 family)